MTLPAEASAVAGPASETTPAAEAIRPQRRLPVRLLAPALVLGILDTLTFAPTPHGGWYQIPLFALLFCLLTQTRTRTAACLLGLAFGFGNFVTGIYWVYISMHDFGGMAPPLAAGALVLFSLYLAIYPALACGIWFVSRPRWRTASSGAFAAVVASLLSAAVFGAGWALGEWLRETVFTGFPWLSAGYAQVDGPLSGFASFIGVIGVGFVTACAGALLAQCLIALRTRQRAETWANGLTLLATLAAAGVLQTVSFASPVNAPLNVRLLQGNVAQDMKFEQSELDRSIALYQRLITEKAADLIVTPETALPILIDNTPPEFARAVREFADRTGSSILLGAAGTIEHDGRKGYTNSTFGLSPGDRELYRYDKHHLVPFGEFVPWGFRWFVNLMEMPLGDFARGSLDQASFIVKGEKFAIDICYEDIFGDEIARRLRHTAAGVLVNSTNLGWFGNSIALDQHLQMARMRALETQRPILRATNTGATAVIDAKGQVQARLPVFTVGALEARVQGMTGLTPYVRFGDIPVLALSLALVLVLTLLRALSNGRSGGRPTSPRTALSARRNRQAPR